MPEKPPLNPADHAQDFAHRWSDRLDEYCAVQMDELGVPENRIGSSDHLHGISWCAFNPYEREAGGVSPGNRINVDSGVLNPQWNAERIGPKAQVLWAKSRLRDRIDATIAHEYEEGNGGSHEYAVETAPETDLPIGGRARALLRAIRLGEGRAR